MIGSGETVGSGGDGATDVAYPHRGAIAIGDDDVVERFGFDDLVVGLDGQARARSRERALGRIGRRIDECAADFLQGQATRGELCRIDLDTDRRALLAAERNQGDARHLGNLLGEEAVGIFVDNGDRQGVRAGRQDQNRRIGRIELLVGRRRGHALRQGLARCRDRRLHVLGGEIDVAIEAELYRDRCGAERAERGHLRDAGDLADLAFQRRRDRGGHGLGARTCQRRRNEHGREVDLRQRRDRQERKCREAEECQCTHHQRRRHRTPDEGLGEVHLTFPDAVGGGSDAVTTGAFACSLYWPP